MALDQSDSLTRLCHVKILITRVPTEPVCIHRTVNPLGKQILQNIEEENTLIN